MASDQISAGADGGLADAPMGARGEAKRSHGGSLNASVARASVWVLGGNFAGQGLRLASNLVLTRLLFPEAFGLMALVNVLLQGLAMFSDIGVRPAIVQHKDGNTDAFLNTAWTIQILRGFGLYIVVLALAWPAALWFGRQDPLASMLVQLLPVAGLTAVLSGFASTRLATMNRKLWLGRLTAIDIGSQVFGIAVMIAGAWIYKSVWALVAGALARSAMKMVLSHVAIPGSRMRLAWDKRCAHELFHFGKWIFLGTAMSFFSTRGDRLIMGSFLTLSDLGVYSIAVVFSQMARKLITTHARRVVFPAYAKLARRDDPERLYRAMRKVKLTLMVLMLPPAGALVILGDWLIQLLYTPPYHDAGRMLQILAVGSMGLVVTWSSFPVLLAKGDSYRHFVVNAARSAALLGGMWLGGELYGKMGLVMGVACVNYVTYPVLAASIRKYRVWMPGLDSVAFAFTAAVAVIAVLLHQTVGF
jgi:O-antigen/teichoic acid export membrane protein